MSGYARDFYPRSPCGERRTVRELQFILGRISIHALLAESDYNLMIHHAETQIFLSTLSLRRATVYVSYNLYNATISIHALLAESDHAYQLVLWVLRISIHALLAESD